MSMIELPGVWEKGFAFDIHVINSIPDGTSPYGRMLFDTTRSMIGEALYQLKYNQKLESLDTIIETLNNSEEFIGFMKNIDCIIPVPPTNKQRLIQPVIEIAKKLSERFGKLMYLNFVQSTNTEQIKNIDKNEKEQRVKEHLVIKDFLDKDKKILVLDDLYDNGSTLSAITKSRRPD